MWITKEAKFSTTKIITNRIATLFVMPTLFTWRQFIMPLFPNMPSKKQRHLWESSLYSFGPNTQPSIVHCKVAEMDYLPNFHTQISHWFSNAPTRL